MVFVHFQQAIQHYSNPSLCSNTKAEKGDVEDLQDLIELTPKKKKKRCPFHHRGLECKSGMSRDTWSNRQAWPWSIE